jgi:inosine-uridine nucleoside N-ribohydrolase
MPQRFSAHAIVSACTLALLCSSVSAAPRRLVIIDQDGSGPGGSNQMAMMVLLQSPEVDVLGITIVSGNAWRDDETQHTLRMLELVGRTDVPVAKGAVFPLVRTQQETRLAAALNGDVAWLGAWGQTNPKLAQTYSDKGMVPSAKQTVGPWDVVPLAEGAPHIKPLEEDAAHFIVRQVRAHPGQVTIYAGGPLTNIALALAIDPRLPELTRGIVMMGGSISPQTDDPEFANSPRHEFNFWFDPEATRMVLRAPWPRVDVTTVDISIKAMFTQAMVDAISKSANPAAQYIKHWSQERFYMWDELAACAWLDSSIITRERIVYMDVDLSHGPNYGETLTWSEALKPATEVRKVHAQLDVDVTKFTKMFVDLMSAPAGAARELHQPDGDERNRANQQPDKRRRDHHEPDPFEHRLIGRLDQFGKVIG